MATIDNELAALRPHSCADRKAGQKQSMKRMWSRRLTRSLGTLLLASVPLPPAVAQAQAQPAADASEARVEALLARMTIEEKAAQLQLLFSFPGMGAKANDERVTKGLGGLLFVSDPKEINRLQRLSLDKSRLGIPLFFAFDVMHGLSTILPVPLGLAASWDPDMVAQSQAMAATEARSVGITWTFGPMIDVARDARWGRIVEGAGEDPFLVSAMGGAQVRGFQGAAIGTPDRVIAGPKHFAGYGAALGGRDFEEANISDDELRNVYLPPFKAAVDAGAGNIMGAYMPLNGVPASANKWLLTDVLRKEWGFNGWVVSDNGTVGALQAHGFAKDRTDAAARALNAGLDVEMAMGRTAFSDLPKALESGWITQRRLDDAVRRVLAAKVRMGLFEHPYADEARSGKILRSKANLDIARVAAERSAVLLKNEGALLPLDRRKIRSVAVIGSLAASARDALGPWVFPQNEPAAQTLLEGIRTKAGSRLRVTYSPGVAVGNRKVPSPMAMMGGGAIRPAPGDDETGIAEAVAAVRKADVAVVVVGEAEDMIGEAASRSTFDLPGRQQGLLDAVVATGKPVVVLLMSARPIDLKETKAQAILDIWYPGSQGGTATANLLFGDAAPGGKLPFTWPRNAGHAPLYYSHLTTHAAANAQSRYWDDPGAPTYPFGHGLSYSTFEYANLKIDRARIEPTQTVTVSVDLKNTGLRAADEVAQLYIHQKTGTAARPVRELKGFQRVTLKPGETRRLSFAVDPAKLRYWNAAARAWVIDASIFDVAVGGNSTAPFGATFEVIGAWSAETYASAKSD